MTKINILDDKVANQIAAGEVVERPASVVKELIENSIDAQAKNVDISIVNGGQESISITDDGLGMASDDAVLALSRYATSKLQAFEDLESLDSFGFRGEALPSIASVSNLKIITRSENKNTATCIETSGGDIREISELGAKVGTRIEVHDLFFNVPARLKFLKSARSEAALIESVVKNFICVYPEVGFSLRANNKLILSAPALPKKLELNDPRRLDRVQKVLGKEVAGYIYPINTQTDVLELSGYVIAPLVTRRDMRGIRLFVNNRAIQDKNLTQMVKIAYRSLLEVGRQPICALNIKVDPKIVDVNVHPQKLEVRFSDPRRVHSHIIRCIGDFLAQTPWRELPLPSERKESASFSMSVSAESYEFLSPQVAKGAAPSGVQPNAQGSTGKNTELAWVPAHSATQSDALCMKPAGMTASVAFRADNTQYRFLGQVDSTYLLLDGCDALFVLDQHAAHERVIFEKIRNQKEFDLIKSQKLLIPIQLEISSSEQAVLEEFNFSLEQFGFEIEPFGPEAILIKAVPADLKIRNLEEFVRDLLSDIFTCGRSEKITERKDKLAATLACHSSVRAGQKLGAEQVEALLESMQHTSMNAHCPHGRPVAHKINFSEMKKWFDRP